MYRHPAIPRWSTARRAQACLALFILLGLGLSQSAWAGHGSLRSTFQVVNLQKFGDASVTMPGAATLKRTRNELEVSIHASELDPNAAYTMWLALFHYPHECATSPCTGKDLRNPEVGAANFYIAGFLTGPDGMANVNARVKAGRLPRGTDYIDLGTGIPPGLMRHKGLRAEAHVILRGHGPFEIGEIAQQIGTGEFDCGPTCSNQQAAVFLPVK